MKKLAFTLAEVLLVVAIIGVVSVLTVNNALKSTKTAEKITQLKKTYDILNAAVMAGMNDVGTPYKWGYAGSGTTDNDLNRSTIEKVLVPHLKLQEDCGTASGCWTSTIKPSVYESSTTIDSSTKFYKGILANGASFAMKFGTLKGNDYTYGDNDFGEMFDNSTAVIFVDVNGPDKGAGKLGDDVFAFLFDSLKVPAGLEPMGNYATLSEKSSGDDYAVCPYHGEYCTAWAFYKGNQDYFVCPNTLSWTDPEKSHCSLE